MAQAADQELTDRFEQFYRNYYREAIGELAQRYPNEQRSLHVDWGDLYRFDPDLADDYLAQPDQIHEYAREALRLYDLPIDVSLGQAHVRVSGLPEVTEIREIRAHDVNSFVAVQGIVRKSTDVRPKIEEAAFECQRCGTLTYIPQSGGSFQEPHECQGCERQGPFAINYDQSSFIDAQKLRVQESPEGLRGGETPQSIDVTIEDDITGRATPGDHVTVTGVLRIEQQESGGQKSRLFDVHMDGHALKVEDEEFEEMDIDDEDVQEILDLAKSDDIYQLMVDSIAPTIYGFDKTKLAITLQLFSGVTKHLPDESRIRGDMHILLIGDPGTGKSQILQYIRHISPRSVYTSGKGSSSAGITAAAVRDDFGDGQQWSLEAGALVLADKGVAAVDELDKMRCVTGDSLVQMADGEVVPIRELARRSAKTGEIDQLENGRTIRGIQETVKTMTDDGRIVSRPVTAIHEYRAPQELVEVTLQSGETLTTTQDHPFFVYENGERKQRPADQLREGEWTVVPRSVPSTTTDGGFVESISGDATHSNDLSPAMGGILGYLAGDGNILYDRPEGIYGIRLTNKEEELLSHFEELCQDTFGRPGVRYPSDQRDNGIGTVQLRGKDHVDNVLDAGANLEIYDGKILPREVTNACREAKAAFIRALADSEGSVDDRKVNIASSSYRLLLGVKMLLLEFGITSQIQTREREEKRDLHYLVITAKSSLDAFRSQIGFTLTRKQRALKEAGNRVSGDRTIIDVIPDCGRLLQEARSGLRLYQSECGIGDATYCNFENGDANISFYRARTILRRFENRLGQIHEDRQRLENPCSWEQLDELLGRYHVSQRELATGLDIAQQTISERWGEDRIREDVRNRLHEILEDAGQTDLSYLEDLVHGDVAWRRVADIRRVTPDTVDDDRIPILRHRLAETLARNDPDGVVEDARELLDQPIEARDWQELRSPLERHAISFKEIASKLDVTGSTVSRWFTETVQIGNFEKVREVCFELIREKQYSIRSLLNEIDARSQQPRVYDLTVEGTHNFVANGMIVHNSEDRSAMHQALEQQEISISKAGINATLKSRCALLGAANPKYGRFDQYEPIGEQIDLEPALVSRFDLIFTVTDQPDEEKDAALADHILQTNYAGELGARHKQLASPDVTSEEVAESATDVDPAIDPDLFRKYIAYAKRNVFPSMTDEARSMIKDFYVDLRARGTDEDAPVPITARKLEALVRLAEASARVRLSDTVEAADAERVIDIVRTCLKDIGVDPETGQFDADVIETGTSKSQRDRIKTLRGLIEELEGEYDRGAPVEEVLSRAEDIGMSESQVEHEIEKLRQRGEIYEPAQNHLRTT